jgi:hypothetical protein
VPDEVNVWIRYPPESVSVPPVNSGPLAAGLCLNPGMNGIATAGPPYFKRSRVAGRMIAGLGKTKGGGPRSIMS